MPKKKHLTKKKVAKKNFPEKKYFADKKYFSKKKIDKIEILPKKFPQKNNLEKKIFLTHTAILGGNSTYYTKPRKLKFGMKVQLTKIRQSKGSQTWWKLLNKK